MDERYLGIDIAYDKDFILPPTGDLSTVQGRKCFGQDLVNALTTPLGDLWSHPNYGFDIYGFLHREDTPLNRLELEQEVQRVISADPRTMDGTAKASAISWDLRRIKVAASCQPVTGGNRLNMVLGYGLYDIEGAVTDGIN
ncbi:MAG: hypothetical protein P4N59_10830 [Negativicutes bacterium]|nr:hypothetical protein [Negativicutes bacterium]